MDKLPVRFLALALLALSPIAVGDEPRAWPELSDFDFVAGRAATKADIEERRAVFLLQSDDVSAGIPLEIEIPQYAYHTNSKTNERTAVVVVQAEELDGKKYVGAVTIGSRRRLLGHLWEFYLFGETPTDLVAGDSWIEEIVVTEKMPVSRIRYELRLAEERLYEEFNQLNDDDAYDIACRKYRPVGSQILRRKCKANLYWRALEKAVEDEAITWTLNPVPNSEKHEKLLREKMQTLAMESQELRAVLAERKVLLEALEQRKDKP
jgi:hypothetical protein